jgi:hypothetical protein
MMPECDASRASLRDPARGGLRVGPRNPSRPGLSFALHALAVLIVVVLAALTLVAAEGYFSGWLLSSIEAQIE